MIHIYYMDFSGDCSYEQSLAFYGILPKERQDKVKSAGNTGIARKRLLTGAFLQYVLNRETGIPAKKLFYQYGEQGKPELDYHRIKNEFNLTGQLAANPVFFNLSHSGQYVVAAVSDQPVGIDIEHKKKNGLAVAKRCFCEAEYADILAADTREEQEKRFLEYWTMKEAYIKHSGEGMHIPLNSFCIVRQNKDLFSVGENTWLKTIETIEPGYQMSICSTLKRDVEQAANNICEIREKELPASQ